MGFDYKIKAIGGEGGHKLTLSIEWQVLSSRKGRQLIFFLFTQSNYNVYHILLKIEQKH